jgi:hypothetical protein
MLHVPSAPRALGAAVFLTSFATSALAAAQFVQPTPKTLVVLGSNTPANNGAALLAALAVPSSPGPNDRWVVILEPGEFDVGATPVVLRDFVDLAGSGRNSSHIVGSGSVVVSAPVGVDTELRDLTVIGRSGTADVTGVSVETPELKMTSVNVEVTASGDGTGISVSAAGRPRFSAVFPRVSAGDTAIGFDVSGGEGAIVNEMFVFILSRGRSNIGAFFSANTGEAVFEQVSGFVASARENYGIFVRSARPRITNNQWTVDGLSRASLAVGLASFGDTTVKDSQFAAGGSSNDTAIQNGGDGLRMQSVVAETFLGRGLPVRPTQVALDIDQGRVEVNQCVLESRTAVQSTVSSRFLSGATKLSGLRNLLGGSICAQSYDGNFTDIPNGPC